MRIKFFNARILTMKDDEEIFEGDLIVNENKIEYVGPSKNHDGNFDREIDCENNLLMPGIKNCHTHSGMVIFRSLADDVNLQDWLNNEIFPRERKFEIDDIYNLTKLAILEYLEGGVTGIGDMYINPAEVTRACEDMGMRLTNVESLNKFGPTFDELENRIEKLSNHEFTNFEIGLHAEYTNTLDVLKQMKETLDKHKTPLAVHMSETKKEVDECIAKYGKSPVKLFNDLGLFDYGGVIYHGVWVDDEDIKILKEKNIHVVTNPCSNLKLASGICPIKKYLENGVTLSIGTDGASSNNALDMFREIYLTCTLAKVRENDPQAVRAKDVLKMAVSNGAKTLMWDCDCLDEGKLADIILLDMHKPNMQPELNIINNIVYSGNKDNVKLTMINGKILYENGNFIGVDVNEIYKNANDIKNRIL